MERQSQLRKIFFTIIESLGNHIPRTLSNVSLKVENKNCTVDANQMAHLKTRKEISVEEKSTHCPKTAKTDSKTREESYQASVSLSDTRLGFLCSSLCRLVRAGATVVWTECNLNFKYVRYSSLLKDILNFFISKILKIQISC